MSLHGFFFPWSWDTLDTELLRVNYLDFLTLIKRQSLLMDEISKGRLPSAAEFQMLNSAPDLFTSYRATVTPETDRELKFFSDLDIINPNAFKFLAAREKALSYKEIKLKKAKGGSGPHEIIEAINALIKAPKHDMKLHSSAIYANAELAKGGHERGRFEIMVFPPILVFGREC